MAKKTLIGFCIGTICACTALGAGWALTLLPVKIIVFFMFGIIVLSWGVAGAAWANRSPNRTNETINRQSETKDG